MDGIKGPIVANPELLRQEGPLRDKTRDLSLQLNKDKGVTFTDTLRSAVNQVNLMQKESDVAMQKLATGKTQNLHEVMIKAEQADIALRFMMQIRNKLISAYQEIMKMQV